MGDWLVDEYLFDEDVDVDDVVGASAVAAASGRGNEESIVLMIDESFLAVE